MVSSTASAGPQPAPAAGSSPSTPPDAHEADVENREAYEYWGYLFKSDKTGTDKLKALLRGLKQVMNDKYETSDQPDLTPNQLAHFYRDLHGNYDQLFLGTPHESIAFIYKSLGCLHSLQPAHHTHATAFTDPTVPALKTEGWIMWQTIQVLLGPEEHSTFLREAVEQWDVKDVQTGETFPKILPRECFPREPDRHMVAWYEGVSERLRREAEEEEKQKQVEVHYEPDQRRLHGRLRPPSRKDADGGGTDDEGSVDSRGPALAYFRNPLYRHVDGRPSIVRQQSKRPTLSPRQTMIDKGKEAASTFSRIARNVGSPHLWDGRGGSRSGSHHDTRRRKSHPDSRLHHSTSPPDDDVLLPTSTRGSYDSHHRSSQGSHRTHRRKGSPTLDRPVSVSSTADDEWWENDSDKSPVYSPAAAAASASIRHTSSHSHSHFRPEVVSSPLRHSRSEEPTPSAEAGDYFSTNVPVETEEGESRPPTQGHDPDDAPPPLHQRGTTPPPVPAPNGVGVMFGPSAGPLFASTVAAAVPPRSGSGQGGKAPFSPPTALSGSHRHRHTQSLGPKASPQRTRFEDSPPREEWRDRFEDGREPSSDRYRYRHEHGHRSRDRDWDRGDRDRDRHAPPPGDRSRRSGESSRHSHSRRSSRRYESPRGYDDDEDAPSPEEFRDEGFDDGRRGSRGGGGGQRGARPISGEAGVKGRRYPDQSPWGRGG